MIVIVGLGNPGEQYKNTRHNVGFNAVDAFAKENNFPEFKLQKKSNALISDKDDILLVKPQTFMNDSGKSVRVLVHNSKFMIHDSILACLEIFNNIPTPASKNTIDVPP